MRTARVLAIAMLLAGVSMSTALTQPTLTLQQAVQQGIVSLESKGGYLGDKVTFIADSTNEQGYTIQIRKGDTLLHKGTEQHLVVTKSSDVFVPAGQRVRLEGIWTACLDQDKSAPSEGDILDVGPHLSSWNNRSAQQLLSLLDVIDTRGVWGASHAQNAIWNITNNREVDGQATDLLREAGIDPTTPKDFPKVSNPGMSEPDTGYSTPPELLGSGDVQATLVWNTTADLDLQVVGPSGETVSWLHPESSTGGQLDQDDLCTPISHGGPENIYWPDGEAPAGEYSVYVKYWAPCDNEGSTEWTLRLFVDGEVRVFSGEIEIMERVEVTSFQR